MKGDIEERLEVGGGMTERIRHTACRLWTLVTVQSTVLPTSGRSVEFEGFGVVFSGAMSRETVNIGLEGTLVAEPEAGEGSVAKGPAIEA